MSCMISLVGIRDKVRRERGGGRTAYEAPERTDLLHAGTAMLGQICVCRVADDTFQKWFLMDDNKSRQEN